jgi:repressor LexA
MTDITKQVSGKSVARMTQPDHQHVQIHFTDGSVLNIASLQGHLTVALTCGPDAVGSAYPNDARPTRRQQDYLEFIARYILRYGLSPSESDIARHFLVSPPSVNQMVTTLERRGFIRRRPGVPRSITLADGGKDLVGRPQTVGTGAPRPNNALHRSATRVPQSA